VEIIFCILLMYLFVNVPVLTWLVCSSDFRPGLVIHCALLVSISFDFTLILNKGNEANLTCKCVTFCVPARGN
jgi:hypothetical protein